MLWPRVIQPIMYPNGMLDVLQISQETVNATVTVMQQTYWPTSFIIRQAGCTAYLLPFDTDMLCLLVTDAAQHWSQRSQMTFWIVFFSVTKNYLFDDGHQCNPRHPDGAVGCYCLSSEITFTSYELWVCVWDELSEWMCVCLCACTCKALHVDICVSEDASLTTPGLLDAIA